MTCPAIRPAESAPRPALWYETPAAKAALAAVVLAGVQQTRHQKAYVLTTDEWYTYEGPLAAKVEELWTEAFTAADKQWRETGDRTALDAWLYSFRPDDAIEAAFEKRGL